MHFRIYFYNTDSFVPDAPVMSVNEKKVTLKSSLGATPANLFFTAWQLIHLHIYFFQMLQS